MKIKIGGIEISDVSPEELDNLIKRYGKSSPSSSTGKGHDGGKGDTPHHSGNSGMATNAPVDFVALKRLVEVGNSGVSTNEIGDILGKRGKAARGALRDWSIRVGLTSAGAEIDSFEDCRVGTSRGVRIKPNLLEVAKVLLSKQQ